MEWQKRIGTLEAEDADQYISRIDAAISRSVDSGKSLETMDSDGRTPLHWASANGHNQIVSTLLNRGADVNAACKFVGQTPLYLASRTDNQGGSALTLTWFLQSFKTTTSWTTLGAEVVWLLRLGERGDGSHFTASRSRSEPERQVWEKCIRGSDRRRQQVRHCKQSFDTAVLTRWLAEALRASDVYAAA
eukprot:3609019-Rhodomonas_salina.4